MKSKKKSFIIVSIFLILLLSLHQLFFLYGDDFFYGTFIKYGFSGFVKRHINHYMTFNGRGIIHIIVSLLLKFNVYLWRILNPILITLTLIIMVFSTNNKEEPLLYLLATSLFLSIPIVIMRESIYWLDGSINYLYPLFLLFFVNYLLLKEKRNTVFTSIIVFLSAASFEQVAMMTIGLIILKIVFSLIERKEIKKEYYIYLFLAILGALTVLLAPGILLRTRVEEVNPPLLTGIAMVLKDYFFIKPMAFYHGINCFFLALYFYSSYKKEGKNIFPLIFSILSILISGMFFLINYTDLLHTNFRFLIVSVYMIILLVMALLKLKTNNQITIFIILSLGSQIMLGVSPSLRYRTFIPPLFSLFMVILHVFNETLKLKPQRIKVLIPVSLLSILGIFNTTYIGKGYYKNYSTHKENIKTIENAYNDDSIDTIILERLPNNLFAHEPLENSDFHVSYLADYYSISDKRVIVRPSKEEAIHKVFLDGEEIIMGTPPILEDTRPFIPINELAPILAYETDWDIEKQMVTIIYKDNTYYLPLGEAYILDKDNKKIELDYHLRQIKYRTVLEANDFGKFFNLHTNIETNEEGGYSIYYTK